MVKLKVSDSAIFYYKMAQKKVGFEEYIKHPYKDLIYAKEDLLNSPRSDIFFAAYRETGFDLWNISAIKRFIFESSLSRNFGTDSFISKIKVSADMNEKFMIFRNEDVEIVDRIKFYRELEMLGTYENLARSKECKEYLSKDSVLYSTTIKNLDTVCTNYINEMESGTRFINSNTYRDLKLKKYMYWGNQVPSNKSQIKDLAYSKYMELETKPAKEEYREIDMLLKSLYDNIVNLLISSFRKIIIFHITTKDETDTFTLEEQKTLQTLSDERAPKIIRTYLSFTPKEKRARTHTSTK